MKDDGKAEIKVEKIDKVQVILGRLIKVKNTKKPKFSNAKEVYFAVQVENANGKGERCLLFTDKEIAAADKRALRNKEDLTKKGFFTDLLD